MATVTEADRLFSGGGGERLDIVTFKISELDKVHRDIIILGDPAVRRNRANVVRTTPNLSKTDGRNTYAMAVSDGQSGSIARALESIYDQNVVIIALLEGIAE